MKKTYDEAAVEHVAREVLTTLTPSEGGATVLALEGELGAGKTTLTKEIAKLLGVAETLVSPTFVIMKRYLAVDARFGSLVHMDAYRIEDEGELAPLRFEELLREKGTLIIIEWPEKIKTKIPKTASRYRITHDGLRRIIKKIHE